MCEITERSVYDQIALLCESGRVLKVSGGGRGRSNHYRILVHTGNRNPEPHSVNGVHKTLNAVHKNPERRSPELYRELSIKGEGKTPPRKFVGEIKEQLKVISDEITRLTDFGRTQDEHELRRRLIQRRKELKLQLIDL